MPGWQEELEILKKDVIRQLAGQVGFELRPRGGDVIVVHVMFEAIDDPTGIDIGGTEHEPEVVEVAPLLALIECAELRAE